MNIQELQDFLGWCTVINVGFLLFWTLLLFGARESVYTMHQKIMRLDRNDVARSHFLLIGAYKIAIIVFCIAPYFALKMVVG